MTLHLDAISLLVIALAFAASVATAFEAGARSLSRRKQSRLANDAATVAKARR